MSERARDLDGVRLTRGVNGFPAGTEGAVISEYEDSALVEVAPTEFDEGGLSTQDLFSELLVDAPYDALEVIQRAADVPDPRSVHPARRRAAR